MLLEFKLIFHSVEYDLQSLINIPPTITLLERKTQGNVRKILTQKNNDANCQLLF